MCVHVGTVSVFELSCCWFFIATDSHTCNLAWARAFVVVREPTEHQQTVYAVYAVCAVYWRLGGQVSPAGKSFRFVSFVRASGRGEAKLRGRAGGDVLCVARAPAGPVTSSSPPARRVDPGWVVPPVVPPIVPPVVPPAAPGWVVPPVVPPFLAGLSRRVSRWLFCRCRSVPGCAIGCPAVVPPLSNRVS